MFAARMVQGRVFLSPRAGSVLTGLVGRYMSKAVGESLGGEMRALVLPRCSSMCAHSSSSAHPAPSCPFSEQVLASGRCRLPERAVSKQRWGGPDDESALRHRRGRRGRAVALGREVVLLEQRQVRGLRKGWLARAGNCDGGESWFPMIWDWFAQV